VYVPLTGAEQEAASSYGLALTSSTLASTLEALSKKNARCNLFLKNQPVHVAFCMRCSTLSMGAKQKKRQQRQHLFRQARMLANAWLDEGVSRAKAVAATAATAVTGEAALRATECPLLHAVVSLGSLVGQGGMSKVYLVPNLGLNDLQGGQWVVKVR
jgi:hypothetical protein